MICISVCDILILHNWLHEVTPQYVVYQVIINVAYILIIDVLVVLIFYFILPKKWFDPFSKSFRASDKERKFYNFWGIRKWKDKIPAGIGFRKDKVYEKDNPDYVLMFLQDSAIAEREHLFTLFIGWIIAFVNPFTPMRYILAFACPVCCTHLMLHLMPVMVQRYNRPKLIILYNRLKEKQARAVVDASMKKNEQTT